MAIQMTQATTPVSLGSPLICATAEFRPIVASVPLSWYSNDVDLPAGQHRLQLRGDIRAALPRGLRELGQRPVPALDGDVADREHTVQTVDAQMIIDGDPSAAALRDVPLRDLVVDPDTAGPDDDVGGQENLIPDDHAVGAHLLHRRIEPQVHAAPLQ